MWRRKDDFFPLKYDWEGFFFLFLPIYSCICTRPIVSGANFFVVVRDFCMGWESVFSVFGGKGTRELEDLYIRQNACIYDLAALIGLES